eukprot:9489977-Pyramimonas_sp.AAC.1
MGGTPTGARTRALAKPFGWFDCSSTRSLSTLFPIARTHYFLIPRRPSKKSERGLPWPPGAPPKEEQIRCT